MKFELGDIVEVVEIGIFNVDLERGDQMIVEKAVLDEVGIHYTFDASHLSEKIGQEKQYGYDQDVGRFLKKVDSYDG